MNRALVLCALAFMVVIPALVSIAAVIPIGKDHGAAVAWAHRIGLSDQATEDVRQLFRTERTERGALAFLGALVTAFLAYAWPVELRRGYEDIWGVSARRGPRELGRPLLWLAGLLGLALVLSWTDFLVEARGGSVVGTLVASPVIFVWAWWSQHMLLAGRVRWRALVPGAVAIVAGMVALSVWVAVYMPHAIESQYDRYGPIGVVFVLLSWVVSYCLIMLGGPLVGHFLFVGRHGPEEGLVAHVPRQ